MLVCNGIFRSVLLFVVLAITGISTISLFAQISRKKLELEAEKKDQTLSILVCRTTVTCSNVLFEYSFCICRRVR